MILIIVAVTLYYPESARPADEGSDDERPPGFEDFGPGCPALTRAAVMTYRDKGQYSLRQYWLKKKLVVFEY